MLVPGFLFIHVMHQYDIYTVKADIHYDTSENVFQNISLIYPLLFTFTLNVINSNILCVIIL